MRQVYIIGVGSTVFARHPHREAGELAAEAVRAALADAGDPPPPELITFGNCALHAWGQPNIRGQVLLDPLMRDGTLPAGTPVINVEAGCATGSAALHAAWSAVRGGAADVALAVGVEKTFFPDDPARTLGVFQGGIDRLHPEIWRAFHADVAARAGLPWEPDPRRVLFLDVHALHAAWHMKTWGTTVEQLARIASKNHHHGALNPKAQFRKELSAAQILADLPVVGPFTRAMCAPVSDGAAACLMVSDRVYASLPERAITLRAVALAGGTWRAFEGPDVHTRAARQAYGMAGIGPGDVHLAEVHDANAFGEITATEALGLCPEGQGGPWAEAGISQLDGDLPVNPSGGLESKGHPLGATGLGMLEELVVQLRREAGPRQIRRWAEVAVLHNAGGMVGIEEALCAVAVLVR